MVGSRAFDACEGKEEIQMNWKRTARWSWLILPFLLLALWPSHAAAGKLAFTVQPSNTAATVAISPAIEVQVQDTDGNLVTTTNPQPQIILKIGTNPGGGTLAGTLTVTASGGVATFHDISIDKAGTGYTLVASAMDLTSATSASFNIIVPAAGLGDANAVLYEVTENLKFRPLLAGRRIATSTLMGTVNAGTAICPLYLFPAGLSAELKKCSIEAVGSNNVNLATGKGPFEGTFAVVINTPDTNRVDGPELVILQGTLRGRIDFSLAIFGPDGIPKSGDELPIGFFTDGRWNAQGVAGGPLQGVRAQGTLTGTFRQPVGTMENAFYLGAGGTLVQVQQQERSLDVPTVRVEIKLVDH